MDSWPWATRNRAARGLGQEGGALEWKFDRALAGSRDRVAGAGSKTGERLRRLAQTRRADRHLDTEHREEDRHRLDLHPLVSWRDRRVRGVLAATPFQRMSIVIEKIGG